MVNYATFPVNVQFRVEPLAPGDRLEKAPIPPRPECTGGGTHEEWVAYHIAAANFYDGIKLSW